MRTTFIAAASVLFGAVISWTLGATAQTTPQAGPIVHLSGNRIARESAFGKAQMARLQAAQQQRATELRAKQQALETTRQQLLSTVDAAQRAVLQQREQEQRTELERASQQVQTDLQGMQRDFNTELQQRVRAALGDIVQAQNYRLVINTDTSVVFSTPELDITNEVLAKIGATP
jgi:Skp family chaperone for outer membrane proteins